jgi:hypothetical protein
MSKQLKSSFQSQSRRKNAKSGKKALAVNTFSLAFDNKEE